MTAARPNPLSVDTVVTAGDWAAALPGAADIAARLGRAAFAQAASDPARWAAVTVALGDDATVRALNRRWRGQDKPTNVLSFPADDPGAPDRALFLGDVVLALETLRREAQEEAKPLADHFAHLVVHGVLHLIGYDHEDDAEADEMEALEAAILVGEGIPSPHDRGARENEASGDERRPVP